MVEEMNGASVVGNDNAAPKIITEEPKTPNDKPGTCGTCKWWNPINMLDFKSEALGVCRRLPPTIFLLASPKGLITQSGFPQVARAEMCGEYSNRQEPAAA